MQCMCRDEEEKEGLKEETDGFRERGYLYEKTEAHFDS